MTQGGSRVPKPMVVGHPKMEKLQEIVVDHFQTFAASKILTLFQCLPHEYMYVNVSFLVE